MKIEIELTDEEVNTLLIPGHSYHLDSNPAECCHCELCGECSAVLHKVVAEVEKKVK